MPEYPLLQFDYSKYKIKFEQNLQFKNRIDESLNGTKINEQTSSFVVEIFNVVKLMQEMHAGSGVYLTNAYEMLRGPLHHYLLACLKEDNFFDEKIFGAVCEAVFLVGLQNLFFENDLVRCLALRKPLVRDIIIKLSTVLSLRHLFLDGDVSRSRYINEESIFYFDGQKLPLFQENVRNKIKAGDLLSQSTEIVELARKLVEEGYNNVEPTVIQNFLHICIQFFESAENKRDFTVACWAMVYLCFVMRNCLPDELALLNDADGNKSDYKDDVRRNSFFLRFTKYAKLLDKLDKSNWDDDSYSSFLHLVKCGSLSIELLRTLRVPEDHTAVAHYTSLRTFEKMLPSEINSEQAGRLAVMNILHMDDESEGKIILDFLGIISHKDGLPEEVPPAFIKCFTPSIDFLPMWELYGDGRQGCCLVFDWRGIQDEVEFFPESKLFYVAYANISNGGFSITLDQNSLLGQEKTLKVERLCSEIRKEYAFVDLFHKDLKNVLSGIEYLFKDAKYSHEKEMRLLYYETDMVNWRFTEGEVKKAFIPSRFLVKLNTVLLGSKVKNFPDILPRLEFQLFQLSRMTNSARVRIIKSQI